MSRARKIILGLVALGLVTTVAWLLDSLSRPEGKYEDPRIAVIGICYLRFKQGHVHTVTPSKVWSDGEYSKIQGKWIWTCNGGQKFVLVPSWKELRLYFEDGQEYASDARLRRLYLPPELRLRVKKFFTKEYEERAP